MDSKETPSLRLSMVSSGFIRKPDETLALVFEMVLPTQLEDMFHTSSGILEKNRITNSLISTRHDARRFDFGMERAKKGFSLSGTLMYVILTLHCNYLLEKRYIQDAEQTVKPSKYLKPGN